jgi:hypothetical protein
MRRVALWIVALFLGALADQGLTDFAPATGGAALLIVVGGWLVFALVACCVVGAFESLFPTLRRRRRSDSSRPLTHA